MGSKGSKGSKAVKKAKRSKPSGTAPARKPLPKKKASVSTPANRGRAAAEEREDYEKPKYDRKVILPCYSCLSEGDDCTLHKLIEKDGQGLPCSRCAGLGLDLCNVNATCECSWVRARCKHSSTC